LQWKTNRKSMWPLAAPLLVTLNDHWHYFCCLKPSNSHTLRNVLSTTFTQESESTSGS